MRGVKLLVILILFSLLFSCSNPGDIVKPTPPPPAPDPVDPVDPVDPDPDPDPDPTPDPPVEPKVFNVDKTDITFIATGESQVVTITSTYDITPSVDNKLQWITTSLNDNLLTISAEENTIWNRSGTITLSVENKIITINIKQSGNLNISKTNKFLYGISDPKNEDLEYTAPNKKQQNWREISTTEWFNAKKASIGVGFDSNMCYAITAANMTHYWFYKNKGYVDEYVREKKQQNPKFDDTHYKPTYDKSKLPYEFLDDDGNIDNTKKQEWIAFETNKSSFATMARTNFGNGSQGGDLAGALNWIFNGRPYMESQNKETPWNLFGDKGFFEKGLIETEGVTGQSKEYIEGLLKSAIKNGESIGILYDLLSNGDLNGKKHVVNLYGIIEDKFGNIVGVWLNDNNEETKGTVSYGLNWAKDSNGYTRLDITNLSSTDFGDSKGSMAFIELITILHNPDTLPNN